MELTVYPRTALGKKAKTIRKEELVPGELYGHNIPNRHVSAKAKEFNKAFQAAGEHTIVTATFEQGEKVPVLIVHVDIDPLSRTVRGFDLRAVRMDEKISAQVPLVLSGEAPAVKAGYVVLTIHDEIHVKSFPQNIPHEFRI